ncbi:MAG: hypothetical protein GY859_24895, partial [Desulfobacterales bacterium]|nr:hypothetical protein [Desulfobacterales bacterium]
GCWTPDWIGTAGAVLDGHYRSAPYSMHVYTGASGSHYLSRPRHTDQSATPGKLYYASAYIYTPPGFGWQTGSMAFIRVSFRNSGYSEISHHDSPLYQSASSSWALFEVTTPAAPSDAAYVRFSIHLQKPPGASGLSIINVDDCFMEEREGPPVLEVNPTFLDFGAANGQMVFKIFNTGGGVLNWSVADGGQGWLSATPGSGNTASGDSDAITVDVDRAGLNPGVEYTGAITVTPDVGDPQTIPVSMSTPGGTPNQPSVVSVDGTRLMVQKRLRNGRLGVAQPYKIKGFAWSPASMETTGAFGDRRQALRDWSAYDLGMMKGAHANTVYTFLDFGLTPAEYAPVLDTLYENGMMAIITVDADGNGDLATLANVVNAYKNHPAILMWAIGNEWNVNLFHNAYSTVQQAAEAAEQAAQLVKSLDANHPVASIYGEVNIPGQSPSTYVIVNTICSSVDVWGLNIYRGPEFYTLFTDWASNTNKPMFLSEFGIDSFHTTQYYPNPIDGYSDVQEQADWNHDLWVDISGELSADNPANVCLGGAFFEWCDEWWKVDPAGRHDKGGWDSTGFPDSFGNEEYFGVVGIDDNIRQPKLTYYTIRDDFQEANSPPTIQVLQPDGVNDAADWTFDITWTDADPDGDASVFLYYDTDNSGEDGVIINAAAISEDDETDLFSWNVSWVPEGSYYIYAVIDDGVNAPGANYSDGVVIITAWSDSDGDGISDSVENASACLEVDDEDTDNDGILDGVEDANRNGAVDANETDPCEWDTDADGLNDGSEDANKNGVLDSGETDPVNWDTDGDGYGDYDEVWAGFDPLNGLSTPSIVCVEPLGSCLSCIGDIECYSSIQEGIDSYGAAERLPLFIRVGGGAYDEDVTVSGPVRLIVRDGAVVLHGS